MGVRRQTLCWKGWEIMAIWGHQCIVVMANLFYYILYLFLCIFINQNLYRMLISFEIKDQKVCCWEHKNKWSAYTFSGTIIYFCFSIFLSLIGVFVCYYCWSWKVHCYGSSTSTLIYCIEACAQTGDSGKILTVCISNHNQDFVFVMLSFKD